MRYLCHFSIDVGKNPTNKGIRFDTTNFGYLQNVRVMGRRQVGINAGFPDQNGPDLIQDCSNWPGNRVDSGVESSGGGVWLLNLVKR